MPTSTTLTHPTIADGWFSETNSVWPGQAMNIKVNQILHMENPNSRICWSDSKTYGNVLVLDGIVQEMIAYLALSSHPNPERVLVIGGGDSGILREVIKYPQVKEVVLCDIGEAYLPGMSSSYSDPRVSVHIGDGFEFLQHRKEYFDVISTDSSDPYYGLMNDALHTGSIVSAQGKCQWLDVPLLKKVMKFARKIFPVVEYAYTTIPTCTSGQIGFILCGKDPSTNFKEPLRHISHAQEFKLFRYYNSKLHRTSFALPNFTRQALATKQDETFA